MEVCMIRMTPVESGKPADVAEVVPLTPASIDAAATLQAPPAQDPAWHPATRVLFRFVFSYFFGIAFLAFAVPLFYIPGVGWITDSIDAAWDRVVPWLGERVLHLPYEISVRPNGSGDTTYSYVLVATLLVAALAACLVWTLADRRRSQYRDLGKWLMIACRYYLAVVLLGYGMAKVFKSQFPAPGLEQLMQPYGDSSPMRLAWTFMGYSKLYTVFAGAGEVLAGLLLLLRRTTSLGALVTVAVMGNVVMLNFGYDIPVKLFSVHLLLFAVALLVTDGRRLLDVLVLNRPAAAADLSPPFNRRRANAVRLVAKTLFIGLVLQQTVSRGLRVERQWGDKRPKPPLYGLYEVSTFVADGEVLPPLVTDDRRWRHFIVDRPGYVSVQRMDGELVRYAFEVDEEAKTAELWAYDRYAGFGIYLDADSEPEPTKTAWTWDRPEEGILTMAGELEGRRISLEMTARDPSDFRLVQRGFRWINEVPFNR